MIGPSTSFLDACPGKTAAWKWVNENDPDLCLQRCYAEHKHWDIIGLSGKEGVPGSRVDKIISVDFLELFFGKSDPPKMLTVVGFDDILHVSLRTIFRRERS